MTPPVKLRAALPDDRVNGLFSPEIVTALLSEPNKAVYVIGVLTNVRTETDNLTGVNQPGVRFHHIEVVDDTHAGSVAQMLADLLQERTGEMMLPFERGEELPAPGQETGDEGN
jgi:hypothetical protein